ncbi:unnamed protein product [Heterobilharzia americana]|nr:unnamed protein product [Heterobilharzia americana]
MKKESESTFFGCIAISGAVLIHFTFGYFYTVANMVPYIMGYVQTLVDPTLPNQASIWLSAVALGAQGISMPVGGMIASILGFRLVVAVSCLATSGGVILTYFTIRKSYVGVIITYGVLLGGGLGLGYSVVLAAASSWFPERRGLVVGLVVGGFGLGALIFTPIQTALINPNNVQVNNITRKFSDPEVLDRLPAAFLILGGILLTLQVVGFGLLRPKPKAKQNAKSNQCLEIDDPSVSPKRVNSLKRNFQVTLNT